MTTAQASAGAPNASWLEGGPELSVRWCIHRAIATLRGQYRRLLGACFVYEVMSLSVLLVGSFCGMFIPLVPQLPHALVRPIGDGVGYLCVRATRGERVRVGGMWDGLGPRYGTVIVIYLIRWLMAVGASLFGVVGVFVLDRADPGLTPYWPALFLPGLALTLASPLLLLFLSARLGFAGLVVFDAEGRRVKAVDALRESWRKTESSTGRLMLLELVTIVVKILSVACVVVPYVLVAVPFEKAVQAVAFNRLFPCGYTGYCEQCGYDIRATVASVGYRCPECGHQNMAPAIG